MRKALVMALIVLLSGPDARAQSAPAPTSGKPPVLVQSCYAVLTIYGFVPFCTAAPVDPDELDRRVADYLSNGAGVLAAPSAGPAAAYFHDASRVLAAPTTSWIPTFPPAATAPGAAPAPEVKPTLEAGAPPPPSPEPSAMPTEPARSSGSWAIDETPSASPWATLPGESPSAAATQAAPPAPPPAPSSPPPAPPAALASSPTAEPTPPARVVQPWWGAAVAGVAVGAGAIFVIGSRIGRRFRAERPRRSDHRALAPPKG